MLYVVAQFEAFDVASSMLGRQVMPRPFHLCGPGAEKRWEAALDGSRRVESEAEALLRARRTTAGGEADFFVPDPLHDGYDRDQRKLQNMATMLHMDEVEVLRRHGGEFSDSFRIMMGAA